ncbi:MAG: hypothetical protein LBQ22_08970 [Bacteroidales bacterium]|jgi:hypothetical protein|nr:hypothetical protein [Bacteroidales bacterium]
MNWKNITILAFVVSMIILTGCTKIEDEVIGNWNFQTFDTRPSGTVSWTFHDDGKLTRTYMHEGVTSFDTSHYSINHSKSKKRIIITKGGIKAGLVDVNGTYRVEEFRNDIIKMTRIKTSRCEEDGAAYLRCELARK